MRFIDECQGKKVNNMKDILQKAWYFGLGVFDFTREKVEALVDEMVRRGEINQQESPEAVKELLGRAQEAQAALVEKVKELVNKALAEPGRRRPRTWRRWRSGWRPWKQR